MKSLKRWLVRVSLGLAVLAGFAPALTAQAASGVTKVPARAAYVMDAQSGQVLYQQNANKRYPIASLSKLLTVYLTVKAIDQGKIKWTDQVPIDHNLIRLSHNSVFSSLRMKSSDQFTVKELVVAAMVASSNSAASALGNYVAGNNAAFIQQMNQQCADWGINAHFISSSGLDNSDLKSYGYRLPGTGASEENLVSAKAISIVAQHLLQADPEITQIASKTEATVNGTTIYNENSCLPGKSQYKKESQIDGLKTGYTENAKLCYTATFWVNGERMIATILGGDTTFSAMNKLIKQVKQTYQLQATALNSRNVVLVNGASVLAAPKTAQVGSWTQGNQTDTVTTQFKPQLTTTELQTGQVQSGDPVGVMTVADQQTGITQHVTYYAQSDATLFTSYQAFQPAATQPAALLKTLTTQTAVFDAN
ncbi:D-alanyl-D-alanine carboxypeptidase family protein [Levilactobacillus acidifarinae]|uniref:D-alanyl-D-alanine carboxypeptidase n=1 Tax=Levilactobacillus acidifarinae DSM 19394 = JCM 15949 TaxID=1423715 RepID=A0A0R1LJM8_9LACO|nr:serine hydrolase [Levilactobacillus acidifarinae]KRK96155.1 D-alanyl-D-alanine carboxypeptidase [Levilactobacillus acidifarinae DSM 19394]GEO69516.1 D-alanyl-D-alanine carboxypeptidase [Levilactobacillus acidifarinae]